MSDSENILSMDEAIERLKTTRPTFYRWLRAGKIKGMKVGRQWRFYAQDIERFLQGEGPRVELPTDIGPLFEALAQAYTAYTESEFEREEQSVESAAQAILRLSLLSHASDVHLENIHLEDGQSEAVLRLRLAGQLEPVLRFDRRLLPALLEQFKIWGHCDPHTQNDFQEGQLQSQLPASRDQIDVRLSFVPTHLGESLSMRILNRTLSQEVTLERLNFKPEVAQALQNALQQGWGMIIASGPSGSGKTTTLYAALNEIASPQVKSFSIEDPVEMNFPWVSSVPIDSRKDASFDEALRAVMQADPDVLMLGEMRSTETLNRALRIALTGHLVLTTLHTSSSLHTLIRLRDLTGNAYTVAEAVKLVVNQRLVRRLCSECRTHKALSEGQRQQLLPLLEQAGLQAEDFSHSYEATGCPACQQRGYRGRFLLSEALSVNGEIAGALQAGATEEALRASLRNTGWKSWLHDGLMQVQAGQTSVAEIFRLNGLAAL